MLQLTGTETQTVIESRPSLPLGGSVRKLRLDRGYGFIAGDDGIDYFFHWTGMDRTSVKEFRDLAIYDRVEFEHIMQSEKGPRAIRIRAVA